MARTHRLSLKWTWSFTLPRAKHAKRVGTSNRDGENSHGDTNTYAYAYAYLLGRGKSHCVSAPNEVETIDLRV